MSCSSASQYQCNCLSLFFEIGANKIIIYSNYILVFFKTVHYVLQP